MAKEKDIDAIRDFMKEVKHTFAGGIATEHTYRPVLKILLDRLGAGEVYAVNEPKRIDCGSPDLALMRKDITIGYLEAKDIGININKLKDANKNQFDRYANNLDNLIYTNCIDWNFYRDSNLVHSISIAELKANKITPLPDNFANLARHIQDLMDQPPQIITTAEELTNRMAKRTEMIYLSFQDDMKGDNPSASLIAQRDWIDEVLVKDITTEKFADMYAQTITYGLFVAKLHSELNNKPSETFTRKNISDLLPKTYPFLKHLLQFIADDTLNPAIDGFIDDLINLYRPAKIKEIMKTYRRGSGREDPFIHFYEAFLTAYNPTERKLSGVYYTPKPVVDFIVRNVDWVLKNKFGLPKGLAHSQKTNVPWRSDKAGKLQHRDVHKVQILDPATGTGTFLAQTIRQIAKEEKASAPGNWSSYVDNDLLPRLHGFEFMMAPYAMAYLKLDMVLDDLGYIPTDALPDRMSIFLTNSLTESATKIPHLPFAQWLEDEAYGAANIKDNFPIMCVIGNPPYSGISKNKGEWITDLIEDYKYIDGEYFNERKHWLQDDYVKFIRLAQHMVDKNGEGVVGMITNHRYLRNKTFRGMRWNLMNSFDEIYILDLHGNTRTGEITPNNAPNENVFDIKQGVSIIIAWKQKREKDTDKPLAKVFRGDLWGSSEEKFDTLETTNLDSNLFNKIPPHNPDYYFTTQEYDILEKQEYEKGFMITELMPEKSVGVVTARDKLTINWNKDVLLEKITDFANIDTEDAREKYKLGDDSRDWNLARAQADVGKKPDITKLKEINYRPFDTRWTYYTGKSKGFYASPCKSIMHHFLEEGNLGLVTQRNTPHDGDWTDVFVTTGITDVHITGSQSSVFPLYLHPNGKSFDADIRPNMNETICKKIVELATHAKNGEPTPIAIFDYIYGILHSPSYRELYSEFLKDDFPRIPYPQNPPEFWSLAVKGRKLRELHLMQCDFEPTAYPFNGTGDNTVKRWVFDEGNNGKVWINKTQYFDNVPEFAWDTLIGGHQPAKLWMSKREGQTLETQDIEHYQKIIAVLVQTKTTMDNIKWSRP